MKLRDLRWVNDPPTMTRERRRSQPLTRGCGEVFEVVYRHSEGTHVADLKGTYYLRKNKTMPPHNDEHFCLTVLELACVLQDFEPYHGEQTNDA